MTTWGNSAPLIPSLQIDSVTAPSCHWHSFKFPFSSPVPCNNYSHFSRGWDLLYGPFLDLAALGPSAELLLFLKRMAPANTRSRAHRWILYCTVLGLGTEVSLWSQFQILPGPDILQFYRPLWSKENPPLIRRLVVLSSDLVYCLCGFLHGPDSNNNRRVSFLGGS